MHSIATIQEVSGCCKLGLLLMFCANASYKLASCTLQNTALLCKHRLLLRLFVGLALPGPRMYTQNLIGDITLSSVIRARAGAETWWDWGDGPPKFEVGGRPMHWSPPIFIV